MAANPTLKAKARMPAPRVVAAVCIKVLQTSFGRACFGVAYLSLLPDVQSGLSILMPDDPTGLTLARGRRLTASFSMRGRDRRGASFEGARLC